MIRTVNSAEGVTTLTTRLYLDADTYLPIVEETKGRANGEVVVRERRVFTHEFIAVDTVPPDFFDPMALMAQTLDDMGIETTAYWLGTRFDPPGGSPPLVISSAEAPKVYDVGYDMSLSYRLSDDPLNSLNRSVVVMQEWSQPAWNTGIDNAVRDHWAEQPCHTQYDLTLEHGHATVFLGYGDTQVPTSSAYGIATPPAFDTADCPDAPFSRIEAVVYLDQTVIFIHMVGDSAYSRAEGITVVLQALEPRETEHDN